MCLILELLSNRCCIKRNIIIPQVPTSNILFISYGTTINGEYLKVPRFKVGNVNLFAITNSTSTILGNSIQLINLTTQPMVSLNSGNYLLNVNAVILTTVASVGVKVEGDAGVTFYLAGSGFNQNPANVNEKPLNSWYFNTISDPILDHKGDVVSDINISFTYLITVTNTATLGFYAQSTLPKELINYLTAFSLTLQRV